MTWITSQRPSIDVCAAVQVEKPVGHASRSPPGLTRSLRESHIVGRRVDNETRGRQSQHYVAGGRRRIASLRFFSTNQRE